MAREEKSSYTIQLENNLGDVVIADEVVGVIAGLAAVEVQGVASMAGDVTKELISKLGKRTLAKGVKVDILENVVTISMAVNMKYGYNIMDVSKKIQAKVKVAVENMTGLEVADVNIRIAGVEIPEEA